MYSAQVNKALSLKNNNHHVINPTLKNNKLTSQTPQFSLVNPQGLSIADNGPDTKIFPFTYLQVNLPP